MIQWQTTETHAVAANSGPGENLWRERREGPQGEPNEAIRPPHAGGTRAPQGLRNAAFLGGRRYNLRRSPSFFALVPIAALIVLAVAMFSAYAGATEVAPIWLAWGVLGAGLFAFWLVGYRRPTVRTGPRRVLLAASAANLLLGAVAVGLLFSPGPRLSLGPLGLTIIFAFTIMGPAVSALAWAGTGTVTAREEPWLLALATVGGIAAILIATVLLGAFRGSLGAP